MQFMNFSLDKLVKDSSDEDFKCLVEEFDSENLRLLKQKGDYPYEYMNSFDLMKKNCLLENISIVQQKRKKLVMMVKCQTVTEILKIICEKKCEKNWDKSDMKNVGDHHDHYFKKKDVLLSADVFEKFIDTFLKLYGLYPCHYFNSPGLWDAMLKVTGVKLEKISDTDKYLIIEKGL